jgi:inosine-uridine nucleoside N-ribohydrolase
MHRQQILEEAIKCVTKDRNATHGEPEDNFKVIAEFWDSYLTAKGRQNKTVSITSTDVAAMMILMKVSRLVTSPQSVDHWVDIAGYAACGGGVATLQQ